MLVPYFQKQLFEILKGMNQQPDGRRFWEYVVEQTCKTFNAEAGTYFALSPDKKELIVTAAYGIEMTALAQMPFRMGQGICGWVAENKQVARVIDVTQDPRFNTMVDMSTHYKTRSIICAPAFTAKGEGGVIEILNRKTMPFSVDDEEFMTILGQQTAAAFYSPRRR